MSPCRRLKECFPVPPHREHVTWWCPSTSGTCAETLFSSFSPCLPHFGHDSGSPSSESRASKMWPFSQRRGSCSSSSCSSGVSQSGQFSPVHCPALLQRLHQWYGTTRPWP